MIRSRLALAASLGSMLLLVGPTAASSPAASVVSHGPRTGARVALTFDDGASPANCRRILSTLVERGVPATFFPIADAMRADPAFWRMVVAVGDPIGDHTMTHPQLPALTQAQQFQQIDGARKLAESISGAPLLRVFRPPYGAYNAATLRAAAAAGFGTVLLWDTSDRDTSLKGTVAEMLAAAERATDGSVILLHCGPNATPYLLGPLLDHLDAEKLQPVTVPTLLGLRWTPSPAASPPTPAEILGGLAPLPAKPSGGVVVGPNGIGTMTFPPGPRSPSPTPAASSPEASPSGSPGADASAQPAGSSTPAPSSTTSMPPVSQPPTPTAATTDIIPLVGLLVVLLAAAVLALGLARTRRG